MSTWIKYNHNPADNATDDCAVRAVAVALGISWDEAYLEISENARRMREMMHRNVAWWSVLRQHGFKRAVIPNTCPDCYSVADFCRDHPRGLYVLGFYHSHVAVVIDGCLIDSWDSRGELPIYYFWRDEYGRSV